MPQRGMSTPANEVVLATDLSEASLMALPWAARFARAWQASVRLVYVEEVSEALVSDRASLSRARSSADDRRRGSILPKLEERLHRRGVAVVHTKTLRGTPRRVITEYAEELQAPLIVMGRRSRSLLGELLIGSTTDRVLRVSRAPVLVVPAAAEDPTGLEAILAPTDFGPRAAGALAWTCGLARALKLSRVVLAHVIEQLPLMPESKTSLAERERCAERLSTLAAPHRPMVNPAVLTGLPPSAGLLEAAEAHSCGLIVAPSTGKGTLGRVFLGSTTERLIERGKVPVLVLPRDYPLPGAAA